MTVTYSDFFFEIQTSQTDYGHDLNYPGTTVECDNQICKFELFTDWSTCSTGIWFGFR